MSNICSAHGASDALGCIGVFTHADGSFGRKRRERDDPPGAKEAGRAIYGTAGGDADTRHTAARTLRAQRTAAMALSTPLIEASVIDASVPSVFQSVTLTRSLAPATTSLMTTSSIANVDSQSFGLQST